MTPSSVAPTPTMPEPASRMSRRPLGSSTISTHGVLQPCPMEPGVAHGTEPRTPQNRTRMRSELITQSTSPQVAIALA